MPQQNLEGHSRKDKETRQGKNEVHTILNYLTYRKLILPPDLVNSEQLHKINRRVEKKLLTDQILR